MARSAISGGNGLPCQPSASSTSEKPRPLRVRARMTVGCSPLRLESLEAPSPEEQRGRRLATRVWGGTWPVLLAIAIVLAIWELIHLSGWKKDIFPGPGATLANLWGPDADRPALARHRYDGRTRGHRVRPRRAHRRGHRCLGLQDPALAGGGRLADHRPADHAVDRLVPVRYHLVRDLNHRHLVRHHPRCRPFDRQRPDRGRGLHPAAVAQGGHDDGAAQNVPVPAPDPAGSRPRSWPG